jgi:hypothetical protein
MSSTGKNIRFSAAVWGTCCGTAVFKQLIFHSWGRVIAHFLLLIFLLSVIITASVFKRAWNETGRMTDVFTAEFGNLTLGPQGMRPSLLPEKARTVAMPGDGRLIYLPDNGNANYSPDDLNVFDYLIIWMPKKQLIAVNHGDDLGWVLLSNSGTASENVTNILRGAKTRYCGIQYSHRISKTIKTTMLTKYKQSHTMRYLTAICKTVSNAWRLPIKYPPKKIKDQLNIFRYSPPQLHKYG